MRRRFQLWGNRQKSKRGSLYDNMEGGRTPSKKDLKKEDSTTSFNSVNINDGASGDNGDLERIKNLSTEESVLKILKVQKELSKVKKRIQDRRTVQQIEIHNLQSRKTKLQHDLNLQLGGSPWTHAEYLAFLREVFENDDEPFPSDKKFSDEAVKTLRQEHKCHLQQGLAKMVSDQSNADLMLVMGSIPELKDEMNKRAERINSVTAQVTKENLELKNVLHYKEYIQDKMKNRMEIKITRRTSLSAAMTGLKNLELKTLQELADADSVDGSEPGIPQPSKWNDYRNNQLSAGLASISDDEPLAEDEDDSVDSYEKPMGNSAVEDSLVHQFQQNAEDESIPVSVNNAKSEKSNQRLKAQLARKQLEEKRKGKNYSTSSHASYNSISSSGSAPGDSSSDKQEDTKDERTRRADAARKRLEAKRRQNRLQKSTSSTSEDSPPPNGSGQQPLQNEGNEKPIEPNGGVSTEKPMMSAAQKARLARQRRAEKMKEQNGSKGSENDTAGAPVQSSLDSSVHQEGIEHSQRSRSANMPPPEEVLKSPLWSVAKRAKDRSRAKKMDEKKVAIPALPDLPDSPDSPKEKRRVSPGRRRAPTSKRIAERRKRMEERLERTSQHKRGSIDHDNDLEQESDTKPLSFSQLAQSKKPESFPTNTLPSMNSDTQSRILQSINQAKTIPGANGNSNSFSEITNSHEENNFPKNTLSSMNSDTQARIMHSLQAAPIPGHPRSGSLPSEKPVVSSAEQRVLQAIADGQRRSSMTNVPTNKVSSAEQRALQAIADGQRRSSMTNVPTNKVSSAEQRALQAIADAHKGGGGSNLPTERRVSSAEQRALQAIADAQKGGGSPSKPLPEKRVSSAEQRALQAIAGAQKGGVPEKRVGSAEHRTLQAIAGAQKGDNGSNENMMDDKGKDPSENQAGSPSELSAARRKKQTSDAHRKTATGGSRLTPSMRDKMTRTQSSRKFESDRVKEQRQRAQLAKKRLEEQRKQRQNRVKRNAGNAETGGQSSSTGKSSNKDESGTDNNAASRSTRAPRSGLATPAGARRNRTTGTTGTSRQTAIERSRARRARMDRSKSNDT